MSDDTTYLLRVYPGTLSEEFDVHTISATKRTTAEEVVSEVSSRLGLDDTTLCVLAELHKHKGEEMVLAQSDHPVQRMLLWPRQFQRSYRFVLRQVDKNGAVLYKGSTRWQAKVNEDSTQRDMAQKGFLPPTEPAQEDYPDLCALSNLTQDRILEVLKMRFLKDKIYTYTADMLISINPYNFLHIYNPKYMTIYQNRKKEELAPHIYAVADTAFTKMVTSNHNQCIVITGKSGSGKTQATHFLVHHTLALCQKSYMTGVEHMLIGCGPVLEALGNAQTEHNYNSSRFGKFLRIYFYESGLLSGADIQTYLLEKSRLVHQEDSERNFHIFYYLLCGSSAEELKEFDLDPNIQYDYISKGSMMSRQEASAELERLRQAMEVVGFFAGAQRNIFQLISAILQLGNVTFKVKKGRDESLEIEDESYLNSVSHFLGLDPNSVKKCLLTRKAKAGAGERFVLDLKLNEANAARDAMAKGLYQMLFEWTVNSINMALAQRTRDNKLRSKSQWIGLLDIFGFEDFITNSFEQFCINYASEHLQHYCIKQTFHVEQEEYKMEGLTWKEVDYADNSGCLELYEKRPTGLFYLIDENFPGANNHTLLSQFNRVHNGNRYYESTLVKEDAFIIKHYAGKVKYQIKDFREKNYDQVREDIIMVFRKTRSSFVREVMAKSPAAIFRWSILRAVVRAASAFRRGANKPPQGDVPRRVRRRRNFVLTAEKETQASYVHKKMLARLSFHRQTSPNPKYSPRMEGASPYRKRKVNVPSRSKKKSSSMSQQYQASMSSLLKALEKANPYFVRCIQPNNKKVPLKLDEKLVLHQLRCSGTLQTIQLQQFRYTQRLTTDKFLEQYKLLFPKSTSRISLEDIEKCLLSLKLSVQLHFQIGKTKIFLRDPACHVLREELHKAVLKRVVLLQTQVRAYVARKYYTRQREAAIKIQSFWRMVETQREIEEWHLAASIIQDAWHAYQDKKCEMILIKIQALCRGYLVRRNIKEKQRRQTAEKQTRSSEVIQRAWRRYRHKKYEVNKAALIIQKTYRGYLARVVVLKMKKDQKREKINDLETDKLNDGIDLDELLYIDEPLADPEKGKLSENRVGSEPDFNHVVLESVTDPDLTEKTVGGFDPLPGEMEAMTGIKNSLAAKPLAATVLFRDKDNEWEESFDISHHHHPLPLQPNQVHLMMEDQEPFPVETPIAVPLPPHKQPKETPAKPQSQKDENTPEPEVPISVRLKKVLSREDERSPYFNKHYSLNGKETSKIGDVFLRAAFPEKPTKDVVKPVVYKPSPWKTKGYGEDKDIMDGLRTGNYSLMKSETKRTKESYKYTNATQTPPQQSDLKTKPPQNEENDLNGIKAKGFENNHESILAMDDVKIELPSLEDKQNIMAKNGEKDMVDRQRNDYKETTFPAGSMNVNEANKANELAQLQKEWLAFQRVEYERQLVGRNKIQEKAKKENKQDRKIREEIISLRLHQMQILKDKLDSFGVGVEAMPELHPSSRHNSVQSGSEPSTPPVSPLNLRKTQTSLDTENHSERKENQENKSSSKEEEMKHPAMHGFVRSMSMESVVPAPSTRPRRQRSNSAIEMYFDMIPSSSSRASKKSNSLNAEAFAKKCMEEEKSENMSSSETDIMEASTQAEPGKRGSAILNAMKTLWGAHKGLTRQHSPLVDKKSKDSVSNSNPALDKSVNDEGESRAVKVRSMGAEQFSPKLLVSSAEELLLLDSFIKSKTSSFEGSHLVDQVFRRSLNEFCANLTVLYSYALLRGNTNGLRYKDIVNNFQLVLEKTVNHYSLDQYAAMMAVNGFRGYMNEFMNDILPKHVVKEAKAKKKKHKDEYMERLGHRFSPVQWGITQVCEVCCTTMWLMESGLVCKFCKFACHKKCFKQLSVKCPGSSGSEKPKTKPKKLFGERLISLEGNDSLVPVFIDKCISYMEMNGIYQEGIYRKSAASTQNKQLEDVLNKDIECQKVNFDDYNIHSVASTFKKFLRSLPDPLIPLDKYFDFLQASKLTDDRERINSLFAVLEGIPRNNHATLERIVFHLARVAQQEATNLMSPSNLAIVFTPCFLKPPPRVLPIEGAEQVGTMTKGVELIINEQMKKIRSTLESISEINHVESSTNERLKQIRRSMGKGNKRRIRPSFREGPQSPNHRRAVGDVRPFLDAVSEDVDLAKEEEKYEQKMATLKSRKETLTTRLPALSAQLSDDTNFHHDIVSGAFPVINEHLRHLNKHRVSALPHRRRPARFSSSAYSPRAPSTHKEEGKPLRKVSTNKGKRARTKRLASIARDGDEESFTRSSMLRSPIHRPHRKRTVHVKPHKLLLGKEPKVGKTTSV